MISRQERIYYIDPVVDHFRSKGAKHGLVLREKNARGWEPPTGKILPLGHPLTEEGALYFSMDGCICEVQPLNPKNPNPKHGMLGFLNDDVFVHGEFSYLNHHEGKAWAMISSPVRSDAKAFPAPMTSIEVEWYAPAASWAKDLMPRVGESEQVVKAKVRQAKERWTQRFVKATALRVANAKDWNDDIQKMKDGGVEFGTVWWNHFVELTAYIKQERSLTNEELELGNEFSGIIGTRPLVQVDLRMALDTSHPSGGLEVSRAFILRSLRDRANERGLVGSNVFLGEYTITPILRSIDS